MRRLGFSCSPLCCTGFRAIIEANLAPFRDLIPVLTSIPGIGELVPRVLLAGADHFDRRAKLNQIKHLVAKIQSLGYDVEIKPLNP